MTSGVRRQVGPPAKTLSGVGVDDRLAEEVRVADDVEARHEADDRHVHVDLVEEEGGPPFADDGRVDRVREEPPSPAPQRRTDEELPGRVDIPEGVVDR